MNPTPPPKPYSDLSEEERVAFFAREIMGWKDGDKIEEECPLARGWWMKDETFGEDKDTWHPTRDENHFRQVLEKVMEDVALFSRYGRHWHRLDNDNAWGEYMKAPLDQRCEALYDSYHQLHA